jgi:Coenzyme PQQ synthesis protein D (PqqD)
MALRGDRLTSDTPCAVEGLQINEVKDGLVVYDDGRDDVHFLNGTAAVVFTLCDGVRDRKAIVDGMAIVFGPDAVSAAKVDTCIAELQDAGILR